MAKKAKIHTNVIEKDLRNQYGDAYSKTFSKSFKSIVKEIDKARNIIVKKGCSFGYGYEEDED